MIAGYSRSPVDNLRVHVCVNRKGSGDFAGRRRTAMVEMNRSVSKGAGADGY
jgi:hypothetical protein